MAGKEIAVKKYVVRLAAEEGDRLDELTRKGKRSAQLLTKARMIYGTRRTPRGIALQIYRWGSLPDSHQLQIPSVKNRPWRREPISASNVRIP